MGDKSTIEWTDATWNPVRGCSIVSKGCTNCYAMRQAHRSHGAGGAYEGLTKLTKGGPVWTGEIRTVPELLDQPLRWRRPRRIFVNSMSDLFHDSVPDAFIAAVFGVMAQCPRHQFQVLTKRPERMRLWLNGGTKPSHASLREWSYYAARDSVSLAIAPWDQKWPLENVWLGVSVEDQAAADERIPPLLQTPAAVRWISAEPLLGEVDLHITDHPDDVLWRRTHGGSYERAFIDWVVAGGESGPGARPMHPDWARSLRDQCALARVPFFFKQWGAWAPINYFDQETGHPLIKLTFGAREKVLGGPAEGTTPCNMKRVGKKVAGRQLDGRTHEEYPE